ncbi:MAG: hypothetical protein ACLU6O_11540 [Bilophila wadsworthia]
MSCTLLPCAPTRRSKASPARAVPCRTARSVMLTPTPRLRDSARTSASARMPPKERRSSPLISINGFMPPPAQCPG